MGPATTALAELAGGGARGMRRGEGRGTLQGGWATERRMDAGAGSGEPSRGGEVQAAARAMTEPATTALAALAALAARTGVRGGGRYRGAGRRSAAWVQVRAAESLAAAEAGGAQSEPAPQERPGGDGEADGWSWMRKTERVSGRWRPRR